MQHPVVSQEEWLKSRKAHLAREKEFSKLRDKLAEERRALPWVKVEKNYVFDTPAGKKSLSELFDGRSQLIVQHFMFAPGWDAGCIGCSFGADHVDGANQHIAQHDVKYVAVSRAPLAMLQAYRKRMGWKFDWVSSAGSDFNFDYHVSFTPEEIARGKAQYNYATIDNTMEELPGYSVFCKNDKGEIFHTYSSYGRGNEELIGAYVFLDMTPKGRNENGLHKNLMDWVKRHDEYGGDAQPKSCCA
jgi:predicted dithiol-disulfide oxidoreductase (DUF899 family)